MFRISRQQMEGMERIAKIDFHRRLLKFLRQEMGEALQCMDEGPLLEQVIKFEQRAARYGIRSEAGIAQFACLSLTVGVALDDIAEVRHFLEQEGMEPEDRLRELVDYLGALEAGAAPQWSADQLATLEAQEFEDD